MKLIVFDMDGVIFEHSNFWLELHKAYGTYKEGMQLTKKYKTTNYQKLVDEVIGRLWKDKPIKPYFDLIKKQKYVVGAKELFKWLKNNNYKRAIISSGPKGLAERAKKELNIDYIYTNELVIENNKIKGTKDIKHWPIRHGNKAEAFRELCRKHHIDFRDAIVVVHDESDIKMARIAGFSIAFCPSSKELLKYCNVIVKKKDLKEIIPVLEKFEKKTDIFKTLKSSS